MRILVDMNLSPAWCARLAAEGHEAVHWSEISDATAEDHVIMAWAAEKRFVVFTHDLDFGGILAASSASAPSVFQVRALDVSPTHLGGTWLRPLFGSSNPRSRRGPWFRWTSLSARARVLPLRR